MPTRYWLIDKALNKAIGTLESTGAVDRVEALIPDDALAATHAAYGAERDALVPADHDGPRPYGGVGGTRIGVKCLHAHYAYHLAGGDDPVGRWVHDQLALVGEAFSSDGATTHGGSGADPVAVVEIGSGAVKVVITDGASRTSHSKPIALVRGIDSDGRLNPAALALLDDALAELKDHVTAAKPDRVAVVATAAARRVTDEASLTAMAKCVDRHFGCRLEVLTPEEEAANTLAGATMDLNLDGPTAVIDIGAGSTEFVSTTDGSRADTDMFALPLGAVDVTRAYIQSDPPGPDELSAALSVIELHLTDLRREAPPVAETLSEGTVIGVGAFDTIARVEVGLASPAPIDHTIITRAAAEEVFRTLATETVEDRAHNPGLPAHHVVDVVGALCLLVETMRQFGIEEIIVRQRGVADGRAAQLWETD